MLRLKQAPLQKHLLLQNTTLANDKSDMSDGTHYRAISAYRLSVGAGAGTAVIL